MKVYWQYAFEEFCAKISAFYTSIIVKLSESEYNMKKFAKSAALIALAIFASGLAGGLTACGGKSQESERPSNVAITKTEIPTDGSLPTAHSAAENLAYVAYVLENQPQYHCYTYTVTNAAIATQYTRSYKDHKDGVTISSDITYSSMVKSGSQALFINGKDGPEVYMRFSEAPKSDTDHLNAKWSQGAPVHYNEQSYLYTYGLFQTELTNYIINSETILDSQEVKVNGDGTYSQKVVLDPVASTYYYQYGMKTRGGLGGYPEFQTVNLTVTFDSAWRVTTLDIEEVALVNKGVTVTSKSSSRAEYSYGEEDFDAAHFAFYNDYFKQYVGSSDLEEGGGSDPEMAVDVTSVLSNGFSKIMDGGQQFAVKAALGKNLYEGYIFLSLDLEDPLNTLEVHVSLGQTLENQQLYVEYSKGEAQAYYGENAALTINLAQIKPHIDAFSEWLNSLNAALSGTAQSSTTLAEEQEDPLTALMNAMVLEKTESEAVLILNTDDLIGTGVGIDANLAFDISQNKINFRSATVGGIMLGGERINLSLNLDTTEAEIISRENTGANANFANYVADVYKLLSSDLIKVDFCLDGNDENVKISGLKGIKILACAYVDIDGVTVGADLNLEYTRTEGAISADISVYYDYEPASESYGKLIVCLTSLGGVQTDVKVACEVGEVVDAVTALMQLAGVQNSQFNAGAIQLDSSVAAIINGAFSANFAELISEVYADNTRLKVSVSIDELFAAFGVDVGVQFGKCNLIYTAGNDNGGVLSVSLPAIGLALNVTGADGNISLPDQSECVSLFQLIDMVKAAYGHINAIIERQSAYFELDSGDTYISVDGITAGVFGSGEVVWKAGSESVALDLSVYIAENGGSDAADIKLVYDKNATDKPMIIIALNGVAIEVYRDDIDGFKRDFDNLYALIRTAFGVTAYGAQAQSVTVEDTSATASDKLIAAIFGVLSDGDLIEFLNNFTLTTDGKNLALNGLISSIDDKYDTAITVSTDGKLTVNYCVTDYDNANAFATGGKIAISSFRPATDGYTTLAEALRAYVSVNNGFVISSTADPETPSFSKIVYEYLFDALGSLSFDNILGSNTYGIEFLFDGNSSNIPALDGVYVGAELYFTGRTKDAENITDEARLTEANIDIDVNGVSIKLNVVLDRVEDETYIYLDLSRVAQIYLPDLKVVATEDDIYSVLEELISIVTDTNALNFVAGMLGDDGGEGAAVQTQEIDAAVTDRTTALADIITKILKLNFSDKLYGVATGSESGEKITQVYLDIDELLKQLEIPCAYSVGCVQSVINRDNHSMVTQVNAMVKQPDDTFKNTTWLSLASKREARRDYSEFDKTKYIDVSFLSTLVSDAAKTLTNDAGEVYNKFSFTGKVSAEVVGILTVNIDDITLTLGFDENGGFYFSLMGYLNGSAVTNRWIGITYHGGYLTLARGLNGTPEYKVMTTAYFIDNIFAKGQSSTINWLLGASDFIWNMVVNFIPSDVKASCDSGLFRTKDLYLYNSQAQTEEKAISIYDYIDALRVIINGATSAQINNTSNISALDSKFGITDNYYGVDLNAELVTGGVLTELYAAILRDDKVGISGIKAYGNISGYVNFLADLTYAEGITQDFTLGSGEPVTGSVCAPSAFAAVREKFETALAGTTFGNDEVLGCYSSSDDAIIKSHTLERFTLTVNELDGTQTGYEVREGSNVYFYENQIIILKDDAAISAESGERLAYVDAHGNLIKTIYAMTADTQVWAKTFTPATITVYNNGEKYAIIKSFVGDFMPTEIDGYTALEDLCDENGVPATELGFVQGDASLYGVFAQTQVEVNSVRYTLVEENGEYVYHATGKGALFNDKYCTGGADLILENKIGNFKVTAIGSGAFANTDGYCIKSVTVPANIVSVGERAFLDNYGMVQAVFFAESVTFKGTQGDKTLPFYGCSTEEGGESTSLIVYYNQITTENGDKWNHFRTSVAFFTFHFWIGEKGDYTNSSKFCGGEKVSGGWSYVNLTVSNHTTDISDFEGIVNGYVSQGLNRKVFSAEDIRSSIQSELNQNTINAEGCIRYCVNVECSKDSTGVTCIEVSVSSYENAYYPVTLACGTTDENGNVIGGINLYGEYVEYNATLYASSVSVNAENATGYRFVKFVCDGQDITQNPFAVTISKQTQITVYYEAKPVTINAISAVAFVHDGKEYASSVQGVEMLITKDNCSYLPTAEGYAFLGWAQKVGESLEFTLIGSEQGKTYYAIWGVSNVGSAFTASANSSGVTPAAPVGNECTLDGIWYSDSTFESAVTDISGDSDGILYVRTQFTFKFAISGGTSSFLSKETRYFLDGNEQSGQRGKTFNSEYYEVWEGSRVSISAESTSLVFSYGSSSCTIRAELWKYSALKFTWSKGSDHTLTPESYDYVVGGNLTINITCA